MREIDKVFSAVAAIGGNDPPAVMSAAKDADNAALGFAV
jgi:hypothetical protein